MKTKKSLLLFSMLLVLQSITSVASIPWTSLNGPFGYNNSQIIKQHQGAIYVSTNVNGSTGTGIFKSTNGGTSWVDVSAGLPLPYARDIEALGNQIFVACDTGVYTSNNQGASWVPADLTLPDFTNVYELAVHQGELYAVVAYGSGTIELFKTANYGQTWTYTGYTLGFSITLNHLFSNGNTLWASTSAGVYKSTNGGTTFISASTNIPFNASITSVAAQGDTAYCGTSNGAYYTTNGGLLWNPITISGLGNPIYVYSWQIIGSTVYAGLSTYSIHSSPLGQNNWSIFGSGFYAYSLPWMMTFDGTSLYAATTEGIYSCPLSGGNWVSKDGNITRARTTIGWADDNLVLAGSGFYSGLKRTSNGGVTWTNTSIINQQGLYKSGIKINNTILMPSSYTMHTSTDDGQTWTSPLVAPIPNSDIAKYGNYVIAPSKNKVVYSDDVGLSWNHYSAGIPSGGTVYSVGVMGQQAFAGVNNTIYKMEYPGAPWTNFSQGITGNGLISSIITVGNTLIVNNSLGIFRRTIEDSLWRPISQPSVIYDMLYTNGFIFVATYDGVYFSDNLGKKFHPWNDGFPANMGQVENLFSDGDVLYAGTQQFSAWKRTIETDIKLTSTPPTIVCTNSSISISANCAVALNSNNKYYLQLSDQFGRFINPINLDSVSGNASTVTITALLPDSLPTSNQYHVRIVSSSPYLMASSTNVPFTIIQGAKVNLQPANQNTCQGEETGFYVGANGDSLTYQWQVDQNGSGFYTNLSNNSTYQNTNYPLLLITNPTQTMNGYRYRCQLMNSCGIVYSNYGTLTVNISTASITNQPIPTTVCSGQGTSFSLTASGTGLIYQWQVNSGFGSFTNLNNGSQYAGVNTSNLLVNFTSANMNGYVYRCKIGTCLFTDSVNLEVNGEPITAQVLSQQLFCDGGNTNFNATVVGAGISYQWEEDNGSGFTAIVNGSNYSGANGPVLQLLNIPASYNNYLYRCQITGLCSPFSSVSNNGELILSPSPTILVQPINSSVCEGDSVSFTSLGTGNFLYYQWEINSGSGWTSIPNLPPYSGVNTSTLQIYPTNAGMQSHQFRCRMSDCVISSNVSLNLLPVPVVTTNDLIVCTNQLPYNLSSSSPNGGIYFGNEIYNGIFHPTGSNAGDYVYTYFYQSPNGCSAAANGTIQLSTCTDLSEPTLAKNNIVIYPNPAREKVFISFNSSVEKETQIQLYSMEGRLLTSKRVSKDETAVEINLDGYADGMYLIRVTNKTINETYRLLIMF